MLQFLTFIKAIAETMRLRQEIAVLRRAVALKSPRKRTARLVTGGRKTMSSRSLELKQGLSPTDRPANTVREIAAVCRFYLMRLSRRAWREACG